MKTTNKNLQQWWEKFLSSEDSETELDMKHESWLERLNARQDPRFFNSADETKGAPLSKEDIEVYEELARFELLDDTNFMGPLEDWVLRIHPELRDGTVEAEASRDAMFLKASASLLRKCAEHFEECAQEAERASEDGARHD